MTPSLFTCTCLLLSCRVLVTFSTGELEFYRDGAHETSEDIALRDLARYLEAQGHQHRTLQRPHLSPFLGNQARKKHHLELGRQKERDLLEVLNDKASLAELLRKEKLAAWNYQRQMQYNDPINDIRREGEGEYDLPYYEFNPLSRPFVYPALKLPYLTHKSGRENIEFKAEDFGYHREVPVKHLSFEGPDLVKGMKEESMLDFHGNYNPPISKDVTIIDAPKSHQDQLKTRDEPEIPDFTFKFDDPEFSDKHPFAVKPNDPRYYQEGPFTLEDDTKTKNEEASEDDTKWDNLELPAEKEMSRESKEEDAKDLKHGVLKATSMVTIPEPERRTGSHPQIVPVTPDLNNDIYFIAIVAGCSAAAMFALVLISLTWCRLQRGVKAAADIEYPAYGVTGPNKDVSPSGDQRLAQSAQMYHFQHQKQQIIAMESRTSATRDPGSVSEAESDEENEEGDYTVYECPGLASTGEMEVKNPLFHDDPTPATPAHSTKEEDHI